MFISECSTPLIKCRIGIVRNVFCSPYSHCAVCWCSDNYSEINYLIQVIDFRKPRISRIMGNHQPSTLKSAKVRLSPGSGNSVSSLQQQVQKWHKYTEFHMLLHCTANAHSRKHAGCCSGQRHSFRPSDATSSRCRRSSK